MSSESEGEQCTPPEIRKIAESVTAGLLPAKSKDIYEATYNTYSEWKKSKGISLTSESTLLAYFHELAKKYKPSSLWSMYSQLKTTINIKEKVNIGNFNTLSAFMKTQSRGFHSKKANVFTAEQVTMFLTNAPSIKYLATKAVLIFGLFGAMRSDELTNVQVAHIKEQGSLLQVEVPKTKTLQPSRSFVISEECVKYVKEYQALRPKNVATNRFFLNYQNGKCSSQVIGKNKFSGMPKQIAEFLNLPDPASYTGHCFRRTSATVLVDEGGDMDILKRHGGWKSSSVAEGYIADSFANKRKIGNMIQSSLNLPTESNKNLESGASTSKRLKETDSSSSETSASKDNDLNSENKVFNFSNCSNVTINYITKSK